MPSSRPSKNQHPPREGAIRALWRIGQPQHAPPAAHTPFAPALEDVARCITDILWIYEPQCARFVYVSPAYERDGARSAAALYDDPSAWLEPVHVDDRARLQRAIGALAAGECYAIEYRATIGGAVRWIWERTFPLAGPRAGGRIAGVSQDITARKEAELAMLQADRRKDEMIAILAHELRNPLAPMRTAAAALRRPRTGGPAFERDAAMVIERQVDHIARLIEDLLDMARIRHGKVRLRLEALRLDDLIDAAVDGNRPRAERRGVQVRFRRRGGDAWVLGDALRLTQVFGNLLHNATKFSAPGGTVEIEVRPGATGEVSVRVRDEGAGIAPERIDSVFDLFVQGPADGDGGLGIGLAVVRSLVQLHRGTVSALSAGVGTGSEFVVTLPTTRTPPQLP